MGILNKLFGGKEEPARPSSAGGFAFTCHQCQASCSAPFAESGSESSCPHCDTPLVVPPRVGQQLAWYGELAPAAYSPPEKAPGVFAVVASDRLEKLFCGLDLKRSKIDTVMLGGESIWLDETQVLKLDLDEESDRTGTLPMLGRTSILGGKVLRYELCFVKGDDLTTYCVASDGETARMLSAAGTEEVLRGVVDAVEAGRVRPDASQPLLREDPDLADEYQERFEKYLDLEIPKVAEGEDYDQLLIFEPTFRGYYSRYGISGSQIETEDDFGRLLGSMPIVGDADLRGEELGRMSIGKAVARGWGFWSNGKLPERTELFQGKRQVSFDALTGDSLQIDQIVSGTFYSLYIARLQRDEFRLGYSIEE